MIRSKNIPRLSRTFFGIDPRTHRDKSGLDECLGDLSLIEITADENGVYRD
jgi:hypothetical protein